MREKTFAKTKKTILPAILIAILCASIGLTAIPPAKALDNPYIYSHPLLVRWEQLLQIPGVGQSDVEVSPLRLTVNVPYVFKIVAPLAQQYQSYINIRFYLHSDDYVNGYRSGDVPATDVRVSGDYLTAYIPFSFPLVSSYGVSATLVYYDIYTQYVYTIYTAFTPLNVNVHAKPMLSVVSENDNPLYGPYNSNYQPVSPNNLMVGAEYLFHIHLYHLSYSVDDTSRGVFYQYNWGDGSSNTITVPNDGYNYPPVDELGRHTWNSAGQYTVSARAGWYLKSDPNPNSPNTIWSDWSYLTVNLVNPSQLVQLTVLAYNNYGYPGYVPLYIDGTYVGTTGYTYTVTTGNHQIYVQSPLYGGGYHVFYCYNYDGNYNYNNPMTLSITTDKVVTAYYYSYY
jgi:hypothetical protein